MNVLRFLDPHCIRLDLTSRPIPPAVPEGEEETPSETTRRLAAEKGQVIEELASIFDASGAVVNPTKLHKDLIYHERQNSTAILPGVALPHVRSLQIRRFVMGLARAHGEGIWYDSLDRQPTRLFFCLAAPPYDDRTYLKVYREVAQILADEETVAALLTAVEVQDVFNVLRRFFR